MQEIEYLYKKLKKINMLCKIKTMKLNIIINNN